MSSETEYVMISGYENETTTYEFQLQNLEYDGSEVSVDFLNVRHGDSAIMEQCEYNLYIGGELVDQKTGSPFGHEGYIRELSGPASGGEDLTLEFYSPYWHDDATNIDGWDGYITFETTVPELSSFINIIRIDGPQSPRQMEDWEFYVDVRNTSSNNINGVGVEITVSNSYDNTATETVNTDIGSSSTKSIKVTANDIKSMLGVDVIRKGDIQVCASIK